MRPLAAALAGLLSHWGRRKAQAVAILAGLAAATALWSGVQALNAEARAAYASAAGVLSAEAEALVAPDGGAIPQDMFIALRRAGWPVSPVIEGDATSGGRRIAIVGIEPATLPRDGARGASVGAALEPDSGADDDADITAFMTAPFRAWMAPETMTAFGLSPGATLRLDNGFALPPAFPREGIAPGTAMMDIGAAQTALGRAGEVTRLLIAGESSLTAPPLEEAAGDALVRAAGDASADLERLTASFHLNLTAFGFLAFAVGLFIVYAASGLAFEQRLSTMRTMRACGVSRRVLTGALLLELSGLALIAGVIGVAAGYVIASALLPGIGVTLRGLYGAPAPGSLAIRPEWWLSGLGMSLFGALAALGASLARAWRLPILASAQPVAWMRAQRRWMKRQAIAAAVLFVVWLVLLRAGDGLGVNGLGGGFAAMAALLIGAALALPPALALLLCAGQKTAPLFKNNGPMTEWFWADARRDMSGVSLALMALLLALAANIGVGSMVGGFRITFTGWLDQRLAADLYLNAAGAEMIEDAAEFLRARDDVIDALPAARADIEIEGWPVEVEAVTDAPLYRETWPVIGGANNDDMWDAVARGEAILVSEQMAQHFGLARGDRMTLPTPSGAWDVRVGGLYADYGNPRGQALAGINAMMARFPGVQPSSLEIVTQDGATADVGAALRDEFGGALGAMLDQESIKALSLSIFERTFAVTAALNVLTLAVAGGALLASLAALAEQRLPQLAPVWALGATRGLLARIELGKTLALAALTAILAIPLGVALAWMLVAVINVEAFGWRLPLHVFPLQWLVLFVLALLAAALAGAGPALRLARMRPAGLAKVFANER